MLTILDQSRYQTLKKRNFHIVEQIKIWFCIHYYIYLLFVYQKWYAWNENYGLFCKWDKQTNKTIM